MPEIGFPIWFYFGFLQHMGWPREKGFLRKSQIVNTMIADGALEQLLRIGRSIGAGDPGLASNLIAASFRKNWADQSAIEELDQFLTENRWTAASMFAAAGEEVPWLFVTSIEIQTLIVAWFNAEVWYGLLNADEVVAEADAMFAAGRERAAEWRAAGLDVNAQQVAESASEELDHALIAIDEFENEVGEFDEAPTELIHYVDSIKADIRRQRRKPQQSRAGMVRRW